MENINEKYTYEEIVNERIREIEELYKETDSFKNLVTYNESKYIFSRARIFPHDSRLLLYYKPLFGLENREPDAHYIDAVWISNIDKVKNEYKDASGNLILSIDNIDEFRDKYNTIIESKLYKELQSDAKEIKRINNGSLDLHLYDGYAHIHQGKNELLIHQKYYACFKGNNTNAKLLYDEYMHSEYDISSLSDYFIENIEKNKDNVLPIELEDGFKPTTYHIDEYGECDFEYFNLNKEEKRYVLTKCND